METGVSGRYYTSRGSNIIHHEAIIHSLEGEYIKNYKTGKPYRLNSGGHGQEAIEYMTKQNIEFNIVHTYENGVRVGNVPNHKNNLKKSGTAQSWFPASWDEKIIVKAAEYVSKLKRNVNQPDGNKMWGKYKGVWVGVIRTKGKTATVFPDWDQSNEKKRS